VLALGGVGDEPPAEPDTDDDARARSTGAVAPGYDGDGGGRRLDDPLGDPGDRVGTVAPSMSPPPVAVADAERCSVDASTTDRRERTRARERILEERLPSIVAV